MGLRFKGQIPISTRYVAIPMSMGGRLFIDVQWKDAVSSATITLETTGSAVEDAPIDAAGPAWVWKTEAGVTIAGPAGTAAGSTKVHVATLCCRRARLKIVAAAASNMEIYSDSELA